MSRTGRSFNTTYVAIAWIITTAVDLLFFASDAIREIRSTFRGPFPERDDRA